MIQILAIKTLKLTIEIYYLVETLTTSVNLLIEKTLEMEKVQDPRLQTMIEEAMDPCNQNQPLPEQVEWEEPQPENIQTGNSSSDQFRPVWKIS